MGTIRLLGLTKLDQKELEGEPGISLEEQSVPEGAHGELVTMVALIAPAAIAAIAAFLLRKHDGEEFEEEIEEQRADGSWHRRTVRYRRSTVLPPDEAVIKAIRGDADAKP